jgi:hypothetical protein
MGSARKLNYDHSVVNSNSPEMIKFMSDVQGCLLEAHNTKNKYDRNAINIKVITTPDINLGDLELRLSLISPIQLEEQIQNIESGLDLKEYGNTSPHRMSVGGDMDVNDGLFRIVSERLSQEDVVKDVFSYKEDGVLIFVIATTVHDADVNLRLSDIYWDIYDEYPQKFQFKPIPLEYFQNFNLPEESKKILGR